MLFEPGNAAADFGFREAEKVAGLGEALGLDDLGEDDEIAKVEHRTSSNYSGGIEPLLLPLQRFVPILVTSRIFALRAPSAAIARRFTAQQKPRESGRADGAGSCDSAIRSASAWRGLWLCCHVPLGSGSACCRPQPR